MGIDKNNILEERMREAAAKNYKEQLIDPKILMKEKNKTKFELVELNKKILRCKKNE